MAEENTQTTSEQQSSSTTQQTQETTLEDVYKTHNVDQMAQEFSAKRPESQTQQTTQRQEVQEISIPDPTLDPNGYKSYETRKAMELSEVRKALSQVSGQLTQFQRAAVQQVEEADIRKAVDSVNEHLGDAKLDPDVVEISLGAEARKDPRFLIIWQNRGKNPKAYSEAIKAFSGKLAKKFAMRADPQLAENQRALREATSTRATTAPEMSQDDKLGKLQGAAFRRAMDDIKNGRTPRLE
jgi:hypothetical protein